MGSQQQFHSKTFQPKSAPPIQTASLTPRPFGNTHDTPTSALDDTPNIQAQLDQLRRRPSNLHRITPDIPKATIQPKLTVGAPGDQYEQEADRMAEQVMSTPEAATQPSVQRQSLEDVQTKPSLQRNGDGGLEADDELESQLNSSKGGGSLLPDAVRAQMEPHFGADFSQVRVHTDSPAVQMNQGLRAEAFTHKQDIYFGSGKYNPGSNSGKQLLAHELTHVVQQTGGIQAKANMEGLIQRSDPEEEQNYTPSYDNLSYANMSTPGGTEVKVDSSNQVSDGTQNVIDLGETTIYSNETEEQNYTSANANMSTLEGSEVHDEASLAAQGNQPLPAVVDPNAQRLAGLIEQMGGPSYDTSKISYEEILAKYNEFLDPGMKVIPASPVAIGPTSPEQMSEEREISYLDDLGGVPRVKYKTVRGTKKELERLEDEELQKIAKAQLSGVLAGADGLGGRIPPPGQSFTDPQNTKALRPPYELEPPK